MGANDVTGGTELRVSGEEKREGRLESMIFLKDPASKFGGSNKAAKFKTLAGGSVEDAMYVKFRLEAAECLAFCARRRK
jgi:hypothetical protein